MERIKNPEKNGLKVVSLFAGIGGFDLAFENAGYEIIFANDIDKYCEKTYAANVGSHFHLGDIKDYADKLPAMDILTGGFPCQPFSTAGNLEGFNDKEKGQLFFIIADIMNRYRPKAAVLENVKNLMNHDQGRTYRIIKETLESLGYEVNCKVLDTQDYGIPQSRKRCVIVCLRKDCFKETPPFPYPEAMPLQTTLQDILDDEVEEGMFLTPKGHAYAMSRGTKGFDIKPETDLPVARTLLASMTKGHRASIDNYITDKKNHERVCDPAKKTELRRLTPNECRKLQGFPADWTQVVSNTQAYKQFGNAVTVDVFYYVAKALDDYIRKYGL